MPSRVSGNFAALGAQPAIASSAAWLDAPARNNPAHELPPRQRPLAESNHACDEGAARAAAMPPPNRC